MGLSNLDTVAVGCCRKLAEKIHNNWGGSVTEYSTDKFKSAIGGLDELILNPLTNRVYPSLASEVVKVKSESEMILTGQGGRIERRMKKNFEAAGNRTGDAAARAMFGCGWFSRAHRTRRQG